MKGHHFSIEVGNLERSVSFYERIMGFVPEMRLQWEDERIAFLTLGHFRLELVQPETFIYMPSNTHMAFEVDDLTRLCEWLVSESIPLVEKPVILDNGWKSVFVSGPDGELLEFLEIPPLKIVEDITS
ncbi:VOC family protein [Paenibacillus sp. MBLB4367]|uniref:VOC family protein n=1 Tax=Paenibacillus sp. MBLB4367 TaxID=3384767 RepID=UPI0039081E65